MPEQGNLDSAAARQYSGQLGPVSTTKFIQPQLAASSARASESASAPFSNRTATPPAASQTFGSSSLNNQVHTPIPKHGNLDSAAARQYSGQIGPVSATPFVQPKLGSARGNGQHGQGSKVIPSDWLRNSLHATGGEQEAQPCRDSSMSTAAATPAPTSTPAVMPDSSIKAVFGTTRDCAPMVPRGLGSPIPIADQEEERQMSVTASSDMVSSLQPLHPPPAGQSQAQQAQAPESTPTSALVQPQAAIPVVRPPCSAPKPNEQVSDHANAQPASIPPPFQQPARSPRFVHGGQPVQGGHSSRAGYQGQGGQSGRGGRQQNQRGGRQYTRPNCLNYLN